MEKLLLFAGTTEGRELAEFLDRQGVSCHVCAATEYGGQLLDDRTSPFGRALTKIQCLQYALDKPGVLTVLPESGALMI